MTLLRTSRDSLSGFPTKRIRRTGSAHRAARAARLPKNLRATNLLGRLVRWATAVLLIGAVVGFLFLAVAPRILGYQTLTMLTGSMSPLINPGDVVVTAPISAENVKVGDIITYHIPVEDHRVETHRVVDVMRTADGVVTVQTKGDANNGADPWVATLDGNVAYIEVASVPYLGNLIRLLREPVVMSILMYGAPGVLVTGLLISIWRRTPESAVVENV